MAAGLVLDGKYRLDRLLGRGSMGEVWAARHVTLEEQFAVKLMKLDPDVDDGENPARAAARFRFEARVAARLSRKTRHIVRVTDHGDRDGVAYLVMELLEGKTLAERLLLRGTLPPHEVAELVAQIARGLEIAHAQGIVHRDLKPANVFLTRDEDGGLTVKLLDFGIARTLNTHRISVPYAAVTGAGYAAGTPGYMSPQQARGGRADRRFDLWALATVAYEALTGDLPTPGKDEGELFENACAGRVAFHGREAMLKGLTGFFERGFAPRPEDRFATASELADAFERAVGATNRPAPPPSLAATAPMRPPVATQRAVTVAMPPPVTRRRGSVASGLAIAGALVFGTITAGVAHAWHPRPALVTTGAAMTMSAPVMSAPSTAPDGASASPTMSAESPPAMAMTAPAPELPRARARTVSVVKPPSAPPPPATPEAIDKSSVF